MGELVKVDIQGSVWRCRTWRLFLGALSRRPQQSRPCQASDLTWLQARESASHSACWASCWAAEGCPRAPLSFQHTQRPCGGAAPAVRGSGRLGRRMLRVQPGPQRRHRRGRTASWLRWLLLLGIAAYAGASDAAYFDERKSPAANLQQMVQLTTSRAIWCPSQSRASSAQNIACASAVTWAAHWRRTPATSRGAASSRDTCVARLAALGLAPAAADGGTGGSEVRLVPAAATAHVTAATVSRRILYDSMAKQLDASPLAVGELHLDWSSFAHA